MNADRFTIKSQEALAAAGRLAEERRNPQLTPEHLLVALLAGGERSASAAAPVSAEAPGGVVLPVLGKLGVVLPALRQSAEQALEALPVLGEVSAAGTLAAPSSEFIALLRAAEREA
ncbi:MAG: Clp protease N-terminal domain-containing protein, partial [Solirubrobacteraceae bacterium]